MKEQKLGTFLGVFTPTILTILGVIMYMRTGWLVGELGLVRALLAVVIANSITLVTTLSFSSVATNKKVGVGGAYYIISRSVGPEIGVAVGIPLFLSQVLSVTLYSFGLAETVASFFPIIPVLPLTLVIIVAVGAIAGNGAEFALKTQIPIMILVAVSLIALAGGALSTGRAPAFFAPQGTVSFWNGFAVFFPAVTGVMAGLGLSGDLKNPQRSIPLGAISATLVGFVIYLTIPFLLSMGASRDMLLKDSLVWTRIAPLGALVVLPGLFGAIFSSAIGSALSAPRTFQALVTDQLHGKYRRLLTGASGERIAFAITLLLAVAAVFIGDLNHVAVVVTMFFLTVYGTINISAALESASKEPSWRPRIAVPWILSLSAGLGCVATMFLINPGAGMLAVFVELFLYAILRKRSSKHQWSDARRGVLEAMIRNSLVHLQDHPLTARNWRPHLLIFVEDSNYSLPLVALGDAIGRYSGIVTACRLLKGSLEGTSAMIATDIQQEMKTCYFDAGLHVFPDVTTVPNIVDGMVTVVQANGIAGLQSNTIMLPWSEDDDAMVTSLRVMRKVAAISKSMLIGKCDTCFDVGGKKEIHIWWGGLQRNGDLMLLIAHLLSLTPEWSGAHIRVMSIAIGKKDKVQLEEDLAELIEQSRIKAVPVILERDGELSLYEMIHRKSATASLVIFGMNMPEEGDERAYVHQLRTLIGPLASVLLVRNSSLFRGSLLNNDE